MQIVKILKYRLGGRHDYINLYYSSGNTDSPR